MSRELLNVNNTDTIKQNDDSTTIILSAHDDNEPRIFKAGDIGTIHISTSQYHIPSIPAKLIVGSNNVNINSADLVSLPAGKYSLELWVSQKDGPKTTIYPSSGALALTIDKNADDLTDKTLTTLTLDDLRKDLHDDVNDAVKHIKVDPSMLDLSDYAKKLDVPAVTLDVEKRTITVNGTVINIPDTVDLSNYATKAELPKVTLDVEKRKITVGDASINVPDNVDLSNYYTKSQIDDKLATVAAGGKVDLSGYVKTEQLNDYAKKTDVPNVVYDQSKKTLTINGVNVDLPDNVDLSDYVRKEDTSGFAKKSDIPTVPVIALDTAKRTLTVNSNVINIPDSVDLTGYVKTVDADAKYATKADVANVEKQPGTPGKDGKRGPVIWQTSQMINTRGGSYSIPISTLTSDVSGTTPAVGDVIIASSDQGSSYALLISSVDSNNVNFTSTVKLSGDNGANGHSVWAYGGSAGNLTTPVSSLLNYDGSREPDSEDLVIGSDGSLAEIQSVGSDNQYSTSETVKTGNTLATIKAQSDNATLTASTFDYSKYSSLPIVSQSNLGHYLGLDSTKSYTLNVDDNTLFDGTNTTQKALKPAIYLLRDYQGNGYNLTIKSDQNYGLAYGTLVQLIVTPYMVFAAVVGPYQSETLCARMQWDPDYSNFYGVSNKWFVVGQESKGTN